MTSDVKLHPTGADESTLYMTSGVQVYPTTLHGSLPDLIGLHEDENPTSGHIPGESGYASLSSDVKERPASSARLSQIRRKRAGSDAATAWQTRASMPNPHKRRGLVTSKSLGSFPKKFLDMPHIKQQSQGGKAEAAAAEPQKKRESDGSHGYTKPTDVSQDTYQGLLSQSSAGSGEDGSCNNSNIEQAAKHGVQVRVMKSDQSSENDYEVRSPPFVDAQRFNSYLSVSEGGSMPSTTAAPSCEVSSPTSTSQAGSNEEDPDVIYLLNSLAIAAAEPRPRKPPRPPPNDDEKCNSSVPYHSSPLLSVPLKKPPVKPKPSVAAFKRQTPGGDTSKPAPPAPPPRRDSVTRSKAILPIRQRLKSNDELASSARDISGTVKAEYRKSSSCPDLLEAPLVEEQLSLHNAKQLSHSPRTLAASTDSGVVCASKADGQSSFVDRIQEYRARFGIARAPSEDYWSEPSSSLHSDASHLSSASPPRKISGEAASLASALPSQRPPPPSALAASKPPLPSPKLLTRERSIGSCSDDTSSSSVGDACFTTSPVDTGPNGGSVFAAHGRRPTVRIPVQNRLVSDTSREYWVLESGSESSPTSPRVPQRKATVSAV